ncbi:MAG: SH3 domain-containing protein [Acidobacteriota bacterium]|jgi:SH3-like domain-containing protein
MKSAPTLLARKPAQPGISAAVLLLLFSALLLPAGCSRRGKAQENAYVTAPQVYLRDRIAAVYNRVTLVKNGERVQVLEHSRRFVRVRAGDGKEGWVEERYLAGQDVFDQTEQLASANRNTPLVATGITENDTNIHITPGRDTRHLYQIKSATKVQILKRATAAKPQPAILPVREDASGKNAAPKPVLEDWWLVRDPQGRVGWVLARMVDIDLPLEVAQYAEGQRIVGAFVLNQVQDGDKKVPQYLMVLTEPHDGMAFDYDQIRVFTWNLHRHRYETAYRERKLFGMFPVTISQENFDQEGVLPVFTLQVQDDSGKVVERKYKLNTPIVRRVLSPAEEAEKAAHPAVRRPRRRSR